MREQVSIYGSEEKEARVGKGRSWMMIQSLARFCRPHGELSTMSSIDPSWTLGHQNENASAGRWESKHSGFLQLRPSPKWAERESHLPATLLPAQGMSSLLNGYPSVWLDNQRRVDTVLHNFNSKILICLWQLPTHWSNIESPLWAVLHYTVNWCYKVR